MYKGNGAMMVRIFPYGAIQFMAFDKYKKVQYAFYCGVLLSKVKAIKMIKPHAVCFNVRVFCAVLASQHSFHLCIVLLIFYPS